MNWECRLSKDARKQLAGLPRGRQEQISRAIDDMSNDPLCGDVLPIKSGKYNALRKRVGRYRIIFSLNPSERLVEIAAILLRTETTYQ